MIYTLFIFTTCLGFGVGGYSIKTSFSKQDLTTFQLAALLTLFCVISVLLLFSIGAISLMIAIAIMIVPTSIGYLANH